MFRTLPQKEGIFTGLSGAAAVIAAIKTAKNASEKEKKNVLCMAPDTGERYLSMNLFDE